MLVSFYLRSQAIIDFRKVGINFYIEISLFFVIFILAVVAIFQFKKLSMQKKIVQLNFLLLLIYFVFCFITSHQYKIQAHLQSPTFADYLKTNALSLILILCHFIALKGIKKDINLLSSADRLR